MATVVPQEAPDDRSMPGGEVMAAVYFDRISGAIFLFMSQRLYGALHHDGESSPRFEAHELGWKFQRYSELILIKIQVCGAVRKAIKARETPHEHIER